MINALTFASTHLDKAILAYQVVESASFYVQNKSPQLHEKLAKIRHIFNGASIGLGLLSFTQLFYQMELRWSLLRNITFFGGRLRRSDIRIPLLFIGLVAGAYYETAKFIAAFVNRFFQPKHPPPLPPAAQPEGETTTKVEWARSSDQSLTQESLCMRALVNVSLACLAPSPLALITTICLQAISFITTARWKTLKYERTFATFDQGPFEGIFHRGVEDRIQKVVISYFRPMLPATSYKNEACFCQSEEGDVSQICSNHAAHEECIVGSIYSAIERFSDPALWFWNHFKPKKAIRHLDDSQRAKKVVYTIEIDRAVLPSCPTCRTQPGYGELEVAIEDIAKPGLLTPAEVTLV